MQKYSIDYPYCDPTGFDSEGNDCGASCGHGGEMTPDSSGAYYLTTEVDARIAELAKYERAVKEHNEQCQKLCGIDDQEGVQCGYRQYFPRRCPNCPTHSTIDL